MVLLFPVPVPSNQRLPSHKGAISMNCRRKLVADVSLNGTRQTFQFDCVFSRKRTSGRELAEVLRVQLAESFPNASASFAGGSVGVYRGADLLAVASVDADFRTVAIAN